LQPVPLPEVQEKVVRVNERMRLKLPATATEVSEFLALAQRIKAGGSTLHVGVVHQASTADYTGDSNNDGCDWLVVGT
jgi:hypothetical protein